MKHIVMVGFSVGGMQPVGVFPTRHAAEKWRKEHAQKDGQVVAVTAPRDFERIEDNDQGTATAHAVINAR